MKSKISRFIRSIYFKITSIFLIWAIMAVILTILLMTAFMSKLLADFLYNEYLDNCTKIVEIYKNLDEEKFEVLIDKNIFNNINSIKVFDEKQNIKIYGREGENFYVDKRDIKSVLGGNSYLVSQNYIGFYIKKNNSDYAIFINITEEDFYKPLKFFYISKEEKYYNESNNLESKINTISDIVLYSIVILGVIIFVYFTKSILKPIKEMSKASKQIAIGNYSYIIDNNRKDEIGELITTFNNMSKELSKIDKMRDEFVSNISHELKTPVTAINGFATILEYNELEESERLMYLQIIQDESLRLSKLSDNLMKLAKLDTDQEIVNKNIYRLDKQIRRIIMTLEYKWTEKNIEFDMDLDKIYINADENLLDQVFINIIDNAIKFSYEDSIICVNIQNYNSYINIEILDNGIGISKENIKRVFDRFYQGDESRSKQGSGLGLSIVKKIVDIQGGNISIDSELGKGTKFIVRIPI